MNVEQPASKLIRPHRTPIAILAALMLIVLLAGCQNEEPSPPSRNIFYEVELVSVNNDHPLPMPTAVAPEDINVSVADDTLLSPEMLARWSINWDCMSDHCQFDTCYGTAFSRVRDTLDNRWLEIDRRVDWNEGCGKPINWLTQVDRYTGQERYPSQDVLFQFWAGAKVRTPEQIITLPNERKVHVWCTGPTQAEVVEEDGWTSLYDGEVCYDVRTGMLVFMSYIKRWVFTGIYEGKTYERAFFGDSETYQQLLESTNAQLSYVEE
ncbi:MAG: hypothetical protein R2873_14815 [Caldilineaceae bacterium]|nr:hypothetical protein [Caldilineaceae bacterium]